MLYSKCGSLFVVGKDIENSKKQGIGYYFCDCDCGKKGVSIAGCILENCYFESCSNCGCKPVRRGKGNHYEKKDYHTYTGECNNRKKSFTVDINGYELAKQRTVTYNNNGHFYIGNLKISRLIMNVVDSKKEVHHKYDKSDNRVTSLVVCVNKAMHTELDEIKRNILNPEKNEECIEEVIKKYNALHLQPYRDYVEFIKLSKVNK